MGPVVFFALAARNIATGLFTNLIVCRGHLKNPTSNNSSLIDFELWPSRRKACNPWSDPDWENQNGFNGSIYCIRPKKQRPQCSVSRCSSFGSDPFVAVLRCRSGCRCAQERRTTGEAAGRAAVLGRAAHCRSSTSFHPGFSRSIRAGSSRRIPRERRGGVICELLHVFRQRNRVELDPTVFGIRHDR